MDVLQSIFVKIWENVSRYDASKAPVRVWLVSCMRHAAIDQARRQGAHRKVLREVAQENVSLPPSKDVPGWKEHEKRIAEAVETLPMVQREAL